jgi:hypothetical protein
VSIPHDYDDANVNSLTDYVVDVDPDGTMFRFLSVAIAIEPVVAASYSGTSKP